MKIRLKRACISKEFERFFQILAWSEWGFSEIFGDFQKVFSDFQRSFFLDCNRVLPPVPPFFASPSFQPQRISEICRDFEGFSRIFIGFSGILGNRGRCMSENLWKPIENLWRPLENVWKSQKIEMGGVKYPLAPITSSRLSVKCLQFNVYCLMVMLNVWYWMVNI